MPTIYNTEAICLRAFPYSETSLIIHCITPDRGRVSAMAKGAKRAKSSLAGACEPLSLNQLQLKEGKSLDVLYQYQSLKPFWTIRQNMLKLACANLMAELVYTVTAEGDADSLAVFQLLKTTLLTLESPTVDASQALAHAFRFQTSLLALCGYQLSLDTCAVTHDFLDDDRSYYPFSPELSGVVTTQTNKQNDERHNDFKKTPLVNVSTITLQVLRDPLKALSSGQWQQASLTKCHRFLQYAVTYRLEQAVKSYQWLGQEIEQVILKETKQEPDGSVQKANGSSVAV